MEADLEADSAAADFGARLEFGQRPSLLLVDVGEAYLNPASPLYAGAEPDVESMIRLVAAARSAPAS